MKFCDRCYVEYEDDEIVQFDKESPRWICLPCKWEFDWRLKMFLIEFFNNQPERLSPEDAIIPAMYGSKFCFGCKEENCICDSLNSTNK